MKSISGLTIFLLPLLIICGCSSMNMDSSSREKNNEGSAVKALNTENLTPVAKYGQLSFDGIKLVSEHGEVVQLKGMSLFWSQWQPQYYNKTTLKQLKDDWGITVIRAAMAIEHEGYLENPEREKSKIYKVVDAAIELGIYVIVDWHDHHAEDHLLEAKKFFSELSDKYGQYPNLIYEPYNEPLEVSWSKVLKPYHQEIISAIRKNDPDNIIICGTPRWSQDVVYAAKDPINEANIGYTLHFYAGTHHEELREAAANAMKKNLPIFVTEFGTTNADGNGEVFYEETQKWLDFMDDNNLSWCNWSIADKKEASAALKPGTKHNELKDLSNLSKSGKYVRSKIIE